MSHTSQKQGKRCGRLSRRQLTGRRGINVLSQPLQRCPISDIIPFRYVDFQHSPLGTMMMISRMMMPMIRHILIFISFHHICFLTLLAPRLKPCADVAKLSVLSCKLSRRSPRSETLLMLLRMTLTVESISCVHSISRVSDVFNASQIVAEQSCNVEHSMVLLMRRQVKHEAKPTQSGRHSQSASCDVVRNVVCPQRDV